jgi:hypothetical protein
VKGGSRPRPSAAGAVLCFIAAAAAIVGGAYFYLGRARAGQGKRIADLESLSARLTAETVPLRFMVVSRGTEGIRARIRLYDLSGKEVALLERTLSGKELYFDFLLSSLPPSAGGAGETRWLAFPYRIFTDAIPAVGGILLVDSYDRSGFPAVFDGGGFGPGEIAAVEAVFERARKAASAGAPAAGALAGRSGTGEYGSAVHEISSLATFSEGVVYRIVCRAKGGIEIMED